MSREEALGQVGLSRERAVVTDVITVLLTTGKTLRSLSVSREENEAAEGSGKQVL